MFSKSDEFEYDKKTTLEERKNETDKILAKYPERIPILVERSVNCKDDIPSIDKSKFITPHDLTVGQLMYVIRKRIKLNPDQAIFLFIKGQTPANSILLPSLYEEYKDTDGWLRIKYTGENTFG